MLMLDGDRSDSGRHFYIAGSEKEKARAPNLIRGIK
jgi:hypothetical protein